MKNLDNYVCDGQMDIFDYLKEKAEAGKARTAWENRKKVGDLVAKVCLGECEVSTITEVEGNERYFFYRTSSGRCFTAEEAAIPVSEQIAKAKAWRGARIRPERLERRKTFRRIRKSDGYVDWAQIGIYDGMLYWKNSCTYEFLEKCQDIDKAYKERLQEIKTMFRNDQETDEEMPMARLYLCRNGQMYATAQYAKLHPGEY